MVRAREHPALKKGLGTLSCSALRKKGSRHSYRCLYCCTAASWWLKVYSSARLYSEACSKIIRGNREKLNMGCFQFKSKENVFSPWGWSNTEIGAQRGCGISILGGTQKSRDMRNLLWVDLIWAKSQIYCPLEDISNLSYTVILYLDI